MATLTAPWDGEREGGVVGWFAFQRWVRPKARDWSGLDQANPHGDSPHFPLAPET